MLGLNVEHRRGGFNALPTHCTGGKMAQATTTVLTSTANSEICALSLTPLRSLFDQQAHAFPALQTPCQKILNMCAATHLISVSGPRILSEETTSAWNRGESIPHDQTCSTAYCRNKDGLGGSSDRHQYICYICLAIALWNRRDPILKEWIIGLDGCLQAINGTFGAIRSADNCMTTSTS